MVVRRLWILLLLLGSFPTLAVDDPIMITHIPHPSGAFRADILLENRASESRLLEMTVYDALGADLGTTTQMVPANQVLLLDSASLHENGTAAYAVLTPDAPLEMGITYSNAATPNAVAYQPALSRPAKIWRFNQADAAQLFEGLVFVNPECGAINLTLHQTQRDGTPILSEPLALEETSKKLVLVLSTYLDNHPGSVITIESSDLLYATALRGDHNGGTQFLGTNHLRTLDPWQEARERMVKSRARWQASGLTDSYTYVLDATCSCPEAAVLPARIAVRYGQIVSATDMSTGEALDPRTFGDLLTVDDVFNRAAAALDGSYTDILLEYDDDLGYPTLIGLNPKRCLIDDETNYTISELEGLR
ncbi:DUF6174 domain-containing protein [Acanthopleuribacter pedis]|uniref:Uncharacterized protein n=1 Tax=Acanthopleuribacter pedis TaxID=442870 RepID=A0A8J7Q9H7_9BACT|nr:DUF6174 domain-containing protein [Acanthopleuribacter pedis]MBO1319899.1 hypothetical protein [Acanthopleuribacter pedis]